MVEQEDISIFQVFTYKSAMASRIILGRTPRNHRHHGMMVQMKKRDLIFFLPENKEYGVQKLGYLGQEVNVNTSSDLSDAISSG